MNLPEPKAPTNSSPKLPYTLVGDEAFPLKDFLMKPFRKEMIGLRECITTDYLGQEEQSKVLLVVALHDFKYFAAQITHEFLLLSK